MLKRSLQVQKIVDVATVIKRNYKTILGVVVFVLLSNIVPFRNGYRLFDDLVPGMIEHLYVTKDLKYVYEGTLPDTLQNACYKQYKEKFPLANHTLYRLQKIQVWKYWRWYDYLREEKWKQPYLAVSEEKLQDAFDYVDKVYKSPDGTLGCRTYPTVYSQSTYPH